MDQSNFSTETVQHIAKNFAFEGGIESTKPFGSGHINDTFLIRNSDKNCPDYLLQRINHHIFKDVEGVVVNIARVSAHLDTKIKGEFKSDKSVEQVLTLIPTLAGVLYLKDDEGNYWRMYQFIADSVSYDLVESPKQAFEGGEAFGRFQLMLADMDPSLLTETLVNFHNITFRLANYKIALADNSADRAKYVADEIALIKEHEEWMCSLYKMGEDGLLPKRITHNDTKFNNILFDKDDNVICIIDLDTVMPGYVAYDFGDAIRTLVNTAEEDEADLTKINVNIELFKAYTVGYLKEAVHFLTKEELKSLYFAVFLFPYMQAIRFLTDYLQGDTYYKIAYPEHNTNFSDNGPLRGMKGSVWEGGTRVAMSMIWKDQLPHNINYDNPVNSLDFLPTALAAAGGKQVGKKHLDGKNLMPYIYGKNTDTPHQALFWRRGVSAAVREGNWKLIRVETDPILLFDLSKDLSETKNLAKENPEKVKHLLAKLEEWETGLSKPHWSSSYGPENLIIKHRMETVGREMERMYP